METLKNLWTHRAEMWLALCNEPLLFACIVAVFVVTITAIGLLIQDLIGPVAYKSYWVKKAAKELGISKADVQTRFDIVVERAKQHCKDWGIEMHFSYYRPGVRRNSLAIAIRDKKRRTIYYAPLWIYLVVAKSKSWETAFMHSVGHEYGHCFASKKGKNFMFRSKAERRFYNWICEVHSDFEGILFMKRFYPTYSRKTILNAIEKKADCYDKAKKPGKHETMTHPSWKLRVSLLKNHGHYNIEVIEEVARASGCTNKDYILEMCSTLLPF